MKARQVLVPLVAFLFVVAPLRAADRNDDPNVVYDPALYQALRYRLIGPYRGGRVTAVTGVAGELWTFYMGTTGGGVWKTTNGGDRKSVV